MPRVAIYPTAEQIKTLYIDQNKSVHAISKALHCQKSSVRKAITEYGYDLPEIRREVCVGDRFGLFEVIEIDGKRGGKVTCRCFCGTIRHQRKARLLAGDTHSCGCTKWKGHGDISGNYWNRTLQNALSRKLTFDITIEEAWDIFIKQQGRCALSGRPIKFADRASKLRLKTQTASLDRIRSNQGYTLDNVQWVHKEVNFMKGDMDEDYFRLLCEDVTNHRGRKERTPT